MTLLEEYHKIRLRKKLRYKLASETLPELPTIRKYHTPPGESQKLKYKLHNPSSINTL